MILLLSGGLVVIKNHYIRGMLYQRILPRVKPRDQDVDTSTWDERTFWLNETMCLRQWLKSWLNWVVWFVNASLELRTPLSELFSPPIVALSDKRAQVRDSNEFVFGLLWRSLDWVAEDPVPTTAISSGGDPELLTDRVHTRLFRLKIPLQTHGHLDVVTQGTSQDVNESSRLF